MHLDRLSNIEILSDVQLHHLSNMQAFQVYTCITMSNIAVISECVFYLINKSNIAAILLQTFWMYTCITSTWGVLSPSITQYASGSLFIHPGLPELYSHVDNIHGAAVTQYGLHLEVYQKSLEPFFEHGRSGCIRCVLQYLPRFL